MKHHLHLSVLFVFVISLFCFTRAEAQSPLETGFTYQGYLAIDGIPANGNCDFQFSLWNALTSGTQVGSTLAKDAVLLTEGVFTVKLDFGAVFDGEARWLVVAARCPAGSGSYTTLSPRQELSAAPYALYSLDADRLDGQQASAFSLSGHTHTGFWNLSGNAGTAPGTNYIGTSDNQALEIRVNGQRVMRMEPNDTSPDILGGYSGNLIGSMVVGAIIGGGGASGSENRIFDDYGVISGGYNNYVGFDNFTTDDQAYATVCGGFSNTARELGATVGGGGVNTAFGSTSTVCGGYDNEAMGLSSVVCGGNDNRASGDGSSVLGGLGNIASGSYSSVIGGLQNSATGVNSAAGGYRAKANHQGSFVWGDSVNADFASTANNQFAVRATGGVLFDIGSGSGLRLLPNATSPNILGGYSGNWITSGVYGAVIAGGGAVGFENRITDAYNTIGGGVGNQAGDNAGTFNDMTYSTIAGGYVNSATNDYATIGGGTTNVASGFVSTIAGGNTNTASGNTSTVSGGSYNTASGQYGIIAGGFNNTAAGNYSYAAGRRGRANHQGAFVWADSTDADFASTAANQFNVRAYGGVRFLTNNTGASIDGNTIWHGGNDGTGSTLDADLLDGMTSNSFWHAGNDGSGSGLDADTLDGASSENLFYWSRGGNSGTTPGTNYIGTSDNLALEIKVDHNRVMRFEPMGASPNILGGYRDNYIDTGVWGATISGGGGYQNFNRVTDNFGTVSGGMKNQAGDLAGATNDRMYATVGGGYSNTASGTQSTVSGGDNNIASGLYSTVAGGHGNNSSAYNSTICGGINNSSTGNHSTACGGIYNIASGDSSFAAGSYAYATHSGSFVFSSGIIPGFYSASGGSFNALANGGVYFYTNGALTSGVYVPSGGNGWSSVSDRKMKDNIDAVDGVQLLENLAAIPISTWNYKSQDESIRHIGPMAQDFYTAFNVGEDNLHISTIDADGVALAGVQALYAENQALKARVEKLEAGQGGGGAVKESHLWNLLTIACCAVMSIAVSRRRK